MLELAGYALSYTLWCLIQHCLFALLCASALVCLTSIISYPERPGRRTTRLLCLLGFALGATSHWYADVHALGF
jgi:hypothetical protein